MKDKFYYTYVLLSLKDHKKYIGHTHNLERRLKEHNNGEVESTRLRRPLQLIYFEACLNKYDAIKREKYFKMGFRRRFLNDRMKNYFRNI